MHLTVTNLFFYLHSQMKPPVSSPALLEILFHAAFDVLDGLPENAVAKEPF